MRLHLVDLLVAQLVDEERQAAHGASDQVGVPGVCDYLHQMPQQLRPLVWNIPGRHVERLGQMPSLHTYICEEGALAQLSSAVAVQGTKSTSWSRRERYTIIGMAERGCLGKPTTSQVRRRPCPRLF